MSDPDASHIDMEILPWSSTRGRPHPQGGRARLSGPAADPAQDPAPDPDLAHDPELRDGWQVLRAAALAPPTSAELAGLDTALEHYRAAVSLSTAEALEQGRRRMTTSTLGTRLGVAAAGAVVLGFGGLSAAALTGSLPGPAQSAVRPVAAAPADAGQAEDDQAQPVSSPTEDATKDKGAKPTGAPTTAVGPDARGPAAFGLCNAFAHGKGAGKAADRSVAFRNLVTAAGGADKVEAYCATVEHPSARAKGKPADHPKGKSADHPKGTPTEEPKGTPNSRPTDKPSTTQGKPSTTPGTPSTTPSTTPGSSPHATPTGAPEAPGKPSTSGKSGKTG